MGSVPRQGLESHPQCLWLLTTLAESTNHAGSPCKPDTQEPRLIHNSTLSLHIWDGFSSKHYTPPLLAAAYTHDPSLHPSLYLLFSKHYQPTDDPLIDMHCANGGEYCCMRQPARGNCCCLPSPVRLHLLTPTGRLIFVCSPA